jgi:hypothetical protein
LRPRKMNMAVSAAGVAVLLLAVGASGSAAAPRAHGAAGAGSVFGGFSAQGFPVVVEMNKSRRRVVRIGMGVEMLCTSGTALTVADHYEALKVSKKGRFTSSFTSTSHHADGTSSVQEGSITGALNRARTKVTGRWTAKQTDRDASGAVTDTCQATKVRWSAKQ